MPEVEEDDVNNSTYSTYKFPIFDNHEALDLSRRHTMENFSSPPTPWTGSRVVSCDNEAIMASNMNMISSSPSNFGGASLSPIAKTCQRDCIDGRVQNQRRESEKGSNNVNDQDEKKSWKHGTDNVISQEQPSTPPHDDKDTVSELMDDLRSARKQVGVTSSKFIDKIRNAAHKRKVAVSRSRDSLVAKEREQLRSIAQSKALDSHASRNEANNNEAKENTLPQKAAEFSLSKSRNNVRFSGFGVPKVEKRPITIPFSPLLGSRRKQKITVKVLEASPRPSILRSGKKKSTDSISHQAFQTPGPNRHARLSCAKSSTTTDAVASKPSTVFKARPMPSSTGIRGHAGQIGVPKVTKRPMTIPVSPDLGKMRQSKLVTKASKVKVASRVPDLDSKLTRRSTGSILSLGTKSSMRSSGENSGLLGLKFVGATPESTGRAILADDENDTPKNAVMQPFEPQSTRRASDRAQFDLVRDENRQIRLEEERERLQEQIRMIQKELLLLGEKI
jgi:hypothetical protein